MKLWERRQRHARTVAMSDVVNHVLSGYGQADNIRRYRVKIDWPRIVGQRIASRTFPGLVQGGVLPIRVSNSSWLHELSFMREALIKQINDAMGEPHIIHDIRLYLARPRREEVAETRPTRRQRVQPGSRALPAPAKGARLAAIEAEAAAIDDPELREVVANVRRRLNT